MTVAVGSIRRLERFGATVRRLVEDPHPATGSGIFSTFRDLACFAAVLGYNEGRERKVEGPSEVLVDGRIFSNSEAAVDFLYLIGLAATQDQAVLLDQDDQMARLNDAFEAYVNGGLEILTEWLAGDPGDQHGDRAILSAMREKGMLDDAAATANLEAVSF